LMLTMWVLPMVSRTESTMGCGLGAMCSLQENG
jgi:hypothetical protein